MEWNEYNLSAKPTGVFNLRSPSQLFRKGVNLSAAQNVVARKVWSARRAGQEKRSASSLLVQLGENTTGVVRFSDLKVKFELVIRAKSLLELCYAVDDHSLSTFQIISKTYSILGKPYEAARGKRT
jgi:hypothetical protein